MTEYLSPKMAAERYPVIGLRQFRSLIHERRIPYSKLGSKVLLATDDIEAVIRAGRVEARSQPGRPLRTVGSPRARGRSPQGGP